MRPFACETKRLMAEGRKDFMRQTLLRGTLILSGAGILCRLLGLWFKIHLANHMTAEALGLYHLILPINGICHTLFASGIQTAISRETAKFIHGRTITRRQWQLFRCGTRLSLAIAGTLSVLLFVLAGPLSVGLLHTSATATGLRTLALLFPFCSLSSCLNGFYYGINAPLFPACSQILEQLLRILSTVALSYVPLLFFSGPGKITCELAIFGIVIGEAAGLVPGLWHLLQLRRQSRLAQAWQFAAPDRGPSQTRTFHAPDGVLPQAEDMPAPGRGPSQTRTFHAPDGVLPQAEDMPAPGRGPSQTRTFHAPDGVLPQAEDMPAPGRVLTQAVHIPAPGTASSQAGHIPAPGTASSQAGHIPAPGTASSQAGEASARQALTQTALPLTLNHLALSLLHSYETLCLPRLLVRFGMTSSWSIACLGVLNGCVTPFLFFPTAITSALSVLLVPKLSRLAASKSPSALRSKIRSILLTVFLLSIFAACFFRAAGPYLVIRLFHSRQAAAYLRQLCWFCPLLFLSHTCESILNGLGASALVFRNCMIGGMLRLIVQILLIPDIGMAGFFLSMYIGQGVTLLLQLLSATKKSALGQYAQDA